MYDYLSAASADYTTTTLSVDPQNVLTEEGEKVGVIHKSDAIDEERISFSNDSVFVVTLQWDAISESDAGTIVDFYHDASKGNGMSRTFQWAHPSDGHTYVVRFDGKLPRTIYPAAYQGITNIKLMVLGYVS